MKENNIYECKQQFQNYQRGKMLGEKVIVLRNVLVIETGDTKIKDDVQDKRKIEQGEVKTEIAGANGVLHIQIDHQYIERLDEQIQKKQKSQVLYEFFLCYAHGLSLSNSYFFAIT
jgi:hypothetical protein